MHSTDTKHVSKVDRKLAGQRNRSQGIVKAIVKPYIEREKRIPYVTSFSQKRENWEQVDSLIFPTDLGSYFINIKRSPLQGDQYPF